MPTIPYNYGADAAPKATDEQIGAVAAGVVREAQLNMEIAQLTLALKRKTETLRKLIEEELPEAMRACGNVTSIGVDSEFGAAVVRMERQIRASLSAEKKPVAITWLRANGGGGLVKSGLVIPAGKEQDNAIKDAAEHCRMLGLAPEPFLDVNTTSFKAFVRERLDAGVQVPTDSMGVQIARVAVVKWKKKEGTENNGQA